MSNLGVLVCITLMEAELKHLLCSFVGNGFPFWDAQKLFPLKGWEHETQGENYLIFIAEIGDNLVRELPFHLTTPPGRLTCVFIIYLIELYCKTKGLKSGHVFLFIDFYAFSCCLSQQPVLLKALPHLKYTKWRKFPLFQCFISQCLPKPNIKLFCISVYGLFCPLEVCSSFCIFVVLVW